MIELFDNIPPTVKERARFWTELALTKYGPTEGIPMIQRYQDSCVNAEEKEFVEFYFHLLLEYMYGKNSDD